MAICATPIESVAADKRCDADEFLETIRAINARLHVTENTAVDGVRLTCALHGTPEQSMVVGRGVMI